MYTKSKLLEKALTRLDFEILEISVYQFLLEERKLNIKNIASKFGTNRMRIYQILDKLQTAGLLTYTKGASREFNLESPTKILGLLKFQETETFKVYEGKAQFMSIFNQILEELTPADYILTLGEGEDFNEVIYVDYFREWMRKRIAKKLQVKILGRPENIFLKEISIDNEKEFRELKFLPPQFKLTEGNMFILPNKIIIWNTVQVQAVVIENKTIAQFFAGIFNGIWDTIVV